jgi:hypothetical protein
MIDGWMDGLLVGRQQTTKKAKKYGALLLKDDRTRRGHASLHAHILSLSLSLCKKHNIYIYIKK